MKYRAPVSEERDQSVPAEKMYFRALGGKEKTLGPDHTSAFSIVNNLASICRDQGKLDEAEQVFLRALAGIRKASTAITRRQLSRSVTSAATAVPNTRGTKQIRCVSER
jgi:hypothetical protein